MSSTVRETALDHISTAQPVAPLPAPEQGKALANGYGCDVFNTRVMRQRLPREVYDRLMRTMTHRTPLDPADADIIAGAMKDWALEHGATHYTHWRYRRIFTMKRYEVEFPLKHPRYVIENVAYKKAVYRIMGWGHPWIKIGRSFEELFLNLRYGNFSIITKAIKNRINKWLKRDQHR